MNAIPPRQRFRPFARIGLLALAIGLCLGGWVGILKANIPGGGTGTGANVTLASTSTTATLSNGIVSILCTKSGATINQINYTFNNGGSSQTLNLLSGGNNGGQLYWEHSNNQGLVFTYSVVADPATNGGDYAEIALYSTTQADMPFEVHYSMRRGSPGFYVAAIWTHDSSDGAFGMGECRDNIYAGSIFNWMSVDATRNKLMQVSGGTAIGVPTAPVECSLWTNGIYQGRYEDKYKYSATFGDQRVWGWSSVGTSGKNVGLWSVSASAEYYNGGPLKPELMCHLGTTILNMLNGGHYGMGGDGTFAAGEPWAKVCGPYFIYCNNVAKTVTDQTQAAQTLYTDALAQGTAEASAWPYGWFSNANYAGPTNRGTVTGKIVISDLYNPNATASNLWVGLIQQPVTSTGTYDFQQWMKPYQFWVHSDANGNFTIPAVIAGANYTLYAFGQGANGTFMSQAQTGGSPPFLANVPASPFSVAVTGGATTALGNVTWTPTRVGPTVFEIGYPDRTSRKFRHGEDWWVGDIGPGPTSPSPVWTKFLEFPFDFPSGLNYVVGTSCWTTDWNFIQPVLYNSSGGWDSSASTIIFNLAAKPASGTQASLFLGIASDYYTALIVTVNGTNLASAAGITAAPSPLASTGFVPTSSRSDGSIREFSNGAFSDERLTFAGTLLKAGANTITISQRQVGGSYFADHAMYDYLRLELTNYVPPAPASVAAYAGSSAALVSWPVVPGATSYKILRSVVNGSAYTSVATGITGPVSGSGPTNATYVDGTIINGTTYYYVVQSANTVGSSANSTQSQGVAPSASAAASAPSSPTGLSATAGNRSTALQWTASNGASYYTVKRSTLTLNGGGGYNTLNTITLANNVTSASYTDSSPTNGSIYTYTVSATNAAGSSAESAATGATMPLAAAPTTGPATLAATALQTSGSGSITLNWSAVSGAAGYLVQRATSAAGPYTFLYSLSSLSVTDAGLTANTTYYYQIAVMNSGGSSPFVSASATTPPAAPLTLNASAGPSKVTLNWAAAAGATGYVISRSLISGGPYTSVASGVSGTSYVDGALSNGTAYYYVVAATGAGGTGASSIEASATPVGIANLTWTGTASTAWDTTTTNWLSAASATAYSDNVNVIFDDTAATNAIVINGTVSPASVVFNNSTKTYSFAAATLAGATGLIKLGTGALNISGTDTYTGGTTISSGPIAVVGGTTNAQNGLGTGPVILQGGALTMNGYTGANGTSYGTLNNDLSIPAGSAGLLQFTQRGGYSGKVTGGGALTLQVNYVRGDVGGDWSGFTGQLNVVHAHTDATVDHFRINSNAGFGTAAINLGPYVQAYTVLNAANSFAIGELSGEANSQLAGIIYNNITPGAYTATYIVGSRNTDAAFAGSITNGASPSVTALVKVGSGTWTLSGACNYTGPTVVSAGTLKIVGSLTNTSSLTVAAGSTLALSGGTVSVAGAITNNGVVRMGGAASITAAGAFTNNGLLDLINGPQTLPANFVNNGAVIDSSAVAVSSISMRVNGVCTVVVSGYAGHTYQLVSTGSLTAPSWQNIGNSQVVPASQTGPVSITLTDGSANGGSKFYRVVVTATP